MIGTIFIFIITPEDIKIKKIQINQHGVPVEHHYQTYNVNLLINGTFLFQLSQGI